MLDFAKPLIGTEIMAITNKAVFKDIKSAAFLKHLLFATKGSTL